MLARHFIQWAATAPAGPRAAGANALARAFLLSRFADEEFPAVEAALTMLLDDPSPRVRAAIAEPLSLCPHAPPHVISALAADQPEVSATVLVRSQQLGQAQLAELAATRDGATQCLIAGRSGLSAVVSAALARHGNAEACRRLLANREAEITAASFMDIAERFGGDAQMRAALLDHDRMPAEARHALVAQLSRLLCGLPLVLGSMGNMRAERLARDAGRSAWLRLIDRGDPGEQRSLAAQLIGRGELTIGLLVEAIAGGRIAFLGACLSALANRPERRVEAILARGSEQAVGALLHLAGIPAPLRNIALVAILLWRDERGGVRSAGPQEASWLMLKALSVETDGLAAEIAELLRAIHGGHLRASARMRASSAFASDI